MLGGFYTGNYYTGISGWIASLYIIIDNPTNRVTSDNISISQKHIISPIGAIHGLGIDNTIVNQKQSIIVDGISFTPNSDTIRIYRKHILSIFDNVLSSQINPAYIINWNDFDVESGKIYNLKEYQSGDIDTDTIDGGIYKSNSYEEGLV